MAPNPNFYPRYPIYIVSKGRADTRLTVLALDRMHVPYYVVVEPQEYDAYAAVIAPSALLTLPFSNLGQGSIPARNWIWDHAIARDVARHWILDDNIHSFNRTHNHQYVRVATGAPFRVCEDLADRYDNVALAGLQYTQFAPVRHTPKPLIVNTRIYSCILIQNDIPYRWRGRYNEDTDLSIRVMKDGWCTLLLNAFTAHKAETMAMKGGNTDELYAADDARLTMAQSLVTQHPDCVSIYYRFGKWQHRVDYRQFKRNRLRLRAGVVLPSRSREYGLKLLMTGRQKRAVE